MSLAPLLNAPLVIQLHAVAAFAALLLGIVQFASPKGTLPHRTVGWIWVVLMLTIAVSSFWIHGKSNRMISVFTGGLIVAGLFTFVPGRIMNAVAFGP